MRGWALDAVWLSAESQGDSFVVTVRGDLDIVTSPELDTCLTQARMAHDRLVLDLSAVDFLDTSALAVIVGHWKDVEAAGGKLALAGARYRYTKTLWITGLADRLAMYESVEQAVSAQAEPAEAEPTEGQLTEAQPTEAQPTEAQPIEAEAVHAGPAEVDAAGESGG
jgi:anti-sigma B factor antagonist